MKELKILKEIKLSDSEKKSIFLNVMDKVGQLPEKKKIDAPTPSPFYKFSFLSNMKYGRIGATVFLLLFLISSTTFASFDALPGDLLYGIKTGVVEKLSDLTAFSVQDKAKRNSVKIDTRIKELESLAEKGRLTEEKVGKLEKNIKENLEDFDRNLNKIDQKDARERDVLKDGLQKNIKEHTEKIKKIRDDDKVDNKHNIDAVLEKTPFRQKDMDGEKNDNKIEKDRKGRKD
jgi:hypothetical protein